MSAPLSPTLAAKPAIDWVIADQTRAARGTPLTLCAMAVILLGLLTLWSSALVDPLYPPDEGRYSSASVSMAEGGSWLIPVFEGEPHLTKPPLTYWAQALCLRLFGHNEGAVRLPSLVASSLTMLLLMWFGWRVSGPRVGILAGAVLSIMPLHIAVGRLAITDPMLNFFWLGTLAFGYVAVQTGRARWAALMWLAISLGLFTKGPLALVPLGILALWLWLSRQGGLLRRLHVPIGLPLAFLPLAAWVWAVLSTHPEARSIWFQQIVGRAIGTGDHSAPFWFYVPYFIGGLFPATAMMVLPGLNIPWREAWARLRTHESTCLWTLAVAAPLVMFSIMSGKLAHYLLPLCPPMALLTAITLDRWLSGAADHPPPGTRPPEVVKTLAICTGFIFLAAIVVGLYWRAEWRAIPLALPFVACLWMMRIWKRFPHLRACAIAMAWLASCLAWMWALKQEVLIRRPLSAQTLVAHLRDLTHQERPRILIYGFRDSTIDFYAHRQTTIVESSDDAVRRLQDHPEEIVLLVDANDWKHFAERNPEFQLHYAQVDQQRLWLKRMILVLRPTGLAGAAGLVGESH